MKREPGARARYEEIAQDLARKIASGEVKEGTRILGRSSLAGTYQVSPETIRRAVAILHERGIVESMVGSGIRVLSQYRAMEYLESVQARNRLEEEARQLRQLLKARRELDRQIEELLDRLLTQVTGALGSRHVEEITVKPDAWVVGRSLGSIKLRSRTGATAVVVTREDEGDIFSPPPDMELAAGDVITITGTEDARARARDILGATTPPPDMA